MKNGGIRIYQETRAFFKKNKKCLTIEFLMQYVNKMKNLRGNRI